MQIATSNGEKDVLVVGAGYLGKRVARLSQQLGYRVFATTRHRDRFDELKRDRFHPILLDWNDSRTFSEQDPPQGETVTISGQTFAPGLRVLVAVAYDPRGLGAKPVSRYDSQVLGLRRLLRHLPSDALVSYVSTTGVYHQRNGEWVDETSTTHPTREAAAVHLQAEQELHRNRPNGKFLVLRLAGIYGPGRIPRVADIASGKPIEANPDTYLNLIHVDDAAKICLRSWDYLDSHSFQGASMQQRLMLVADHYPVARGEFYREVARQVGGPSPSFVPPAATTSPRRRGEANKRICNRKMARSLMSNLAFPDYRQGLVSALG
ncbi:NAD-dependent epimerase/dehydratase family protein [Rhodopirellula sp. MGV]|uniref:NAD-dependent epimerase/dehydratase family protein n=1 Tax=Rhodopirellula sp. MGV TaxID=2023130 RepID=UPI000B978A33|nr:NAD-dependent epimerase/dehydratase family protein [Rhodopirellula sp. MGV]OYP37084.1 hypothetical protein CGZ80_06425 [Rhodopirellula sp. MGV]PNY36301.1 NAD(P)-dependent oxidoreductase [Rhodopirellula baltica]